MVFLAGGLGLKDEENEGAEVDGEGDKVTAKRLDVGLIFFFRLNFLDLHFQTGSCKPEFICKP